jgi:hypothetical protein
MAKISKRKAVPARPVRRPVARDTEYSVSLYSSDGKKIDPKLGGICLDLEKDLGKRILLLIQNPSRDMLSSPYSDMAQQLAIALRREFKTLRSCSELVVILDSPGGYAKSAYQISTLLEASCGGYDVIIPRYAKSAATLFALGGRTIYMGTHAELGPLDAQVQDEDREEYESALNEVQALEQISLFSQRVVDQTVLMLLGRTGKKLENIIPLALRFAENLTKPLFEKIDVVHYSKMSRILQIGQEYAARLLKKRYPKQVADSIAQYLVTGYPDHDFMINMGEANEIVAKFTNSKGNPLVRSFDQKEDVQEKVNDIYNILVAKPNIAIGFVSSKLKEAV